MKLFLTLFALFTLGIGSYAQQYKVYSVVGNVTSNGKPIQKGILINGNCPITIPDKSKVILLDETAKEMITLSTASSGLLKDLIIPIKNKKKLTDAYFQYVLKKMAEDDSPLDKNVMQSSASSYRDGDSTILNLCCPEGDSVGPTNP